MILLLGIFLLISSFLIHFIIWHIYLPDKHTKSLTLIFLAVPLIILTLMIKITPYWMPKNLWEYISLFIFYSSCSLVYICLYTLIEHRSPTITLVEKISLQGKCTINAAYEILDDKNLFDARLYQMYQNGMILIENNNYILTRKGSLFISSFNLIGKILHSKIEN